jgi:murein DD-endopeptidase MepM/ murein hydrolase activator NlpD
MRGKISILLLSCIALFQAAFSQNPFRRDYFRAPIDIDMYLSGNFGELRSNHFHAGIDIKTQGVIGHRIYASADGYVSRIKVEAAGYGNTLYLTHPAGYTTVYAHLDRFRKDIAEFVREKQYSRRQHAMNIFPGREDFPVSKGDMIAFSGTSGYSFGPHLHYEIRDAANQEPLNVLLFGFDIEDIVAPRYRSLYLYTMGEDNPPNNSYEKIRIELKAENGRYYLKATDTLIGWGNMGFGIEAYDYLNGAHNRCGLYRIQMFVDEDLKYEWQMDRFPFSKARYINSYIDYHERVTNGKLVQKTFVEPNNRLDLYRKVENSGIMDLSEDRSFDIRFVIADAYENTSELNFVIRGGGALGNDLMQGGPYGLPGNPEPVLPENFFNCREENVFRSENIMLTLPAGALYTDLNFRYESGKQKPGTYSPVHQIHYNHTPVQLPCELGIRPVGLPVELREKALITTIDEDGEISPAGGEWNDGMIKTSIRDFGEYTVVVDTLEPSIRSLDLDGNGGPLERKSIRFLVKDEVSGIKSYEGYIDNEWVLFEYDMKNDLVFYRIDPDRLSPGQDHELELYIIDNKENIAYYYAVFHW